MKKLIWLFVLFFTIHLALPAQNDQVPVVYSITGKVKYAASENAKLEKIQPGTELAPGGTLKIYPGATVGIFYDEEYAVVNTSGEQNVAAITGNVSLFRENDLAELMSGQVDEALNPYFQVRSGFAEAGDPPPPPPSKLEKDGHGNKEYEIIRLQPTGGKVSGSELGFSWKLDDPERKLKKFRFTLRSSDDEVLWQQEVKGFDLDLNSTDYRLENGKTYKWQVSALEDPELNTPNISFVYAAPAELSELQRSLRSSGMYQTGDPAAKMLMEASVLEQAGFLAEAYDRLATAARKNKKNQLAQLLYESFRWRYDMIE
ncbi:DUF928 domain-containing protein [Flavilitoribacter nigricans]|uniref:Uncharacterized protein n=1 Tax=Flavilitoribacter nigricans (strain ATCC 23147 / DSM 23189 / NBRC 102662 / NCIMB 1420 / SS-2) TaxID=1122177 RepID=A0A2D0NH56_FLAN2|nr:DUF928 domain-containing protein [Flavilitoribacter nigricans]PHN07834.1 hypothetical protein CRP01_03530 [Flavilitoribacter nigricans DSM 23189 = NBRC 102662]